MSLFKLRESYQAHPLKWWHAPLLIILIVGTYLAAREYRGTAQAGPWPQSEVQHNAGSIFGTVYHLTYQAPVDYGWQVDSLLNELDASLSPFNPASTISRINDNSLTQVDERLERVFTLAKEVWNSTDGAFDITVAPLVNAWGFGFQQAQEVDSALVDSLMRFVGFGKVNLTTEGNIEKDDPRLMLDCAAIAKGYAVDEVADWLWTRGVENYMVEIGGELRLSGHNPQGTDWRIGVSNPHEADSTEAPLQNVLTLTNTAVATSGNYRNFIEKNGRKFAHTIDPHSGYPIQRDILSATVLAGTCAEADAYATAFMVSGLEASMQILEQQTQLKAYIIYADSNGQMLTWASEGLGL